MIFDHQHDRTLVQAQVPLRDPALSVACLEARIEAAEKAVLALHVGVALLQVMDRRDDDPSLAR